MPANHMESLIEAAKGHLDLALGRLRSGDDGISGDLMRAAYFVDQARNDHDEWLRVKATIKPSDKAHLKGA